MLFWFTHHTRIVSHQGQVGHRSCHQHLEQGLGSAFVACLPHSQLYQPGQTMLCYLATFAIISECFTMLKGTRLLQ